MTMSANVRHLSTGLDNAVHISRRDEVVGQFAIILHRYGTVCRMGDHKTFAARNGSSIFKLILLYDRTKVGIVQLASLLNHLFLLRLHLSNILQKLKWFPESRDVHSVFLSLHFGLLHRNDRYMSLDSWKQNPYVLQLSFSLKRVRTLHHCLCFPFPHYTIWNEQRSGLKTQKWLESWMAGTKRQEPIICQAL